MTDTPLPPGDEPQNEPGGDQAPNPRMASITLRREKDQTSASSLMDPANQSLADAIRIMFGILKFAMVVIGVLYIFSGVQTVGVGESSVHLRFGKRVGDNLPPGIHFALPFPVGELILVETGAQTLDLDEAFWPRVSDRDKSKSVDELSSRVTQSLRPGDDGSLITADGNIAHTQWRATYSRVQPGRYVENILKESELSIVRASIERGVTQAVAAIRIDDLLKQSLTNQSSVAEHARQIAQSALDRAQSGIRLDSLELKEKMPPLQVRMKFQAVQTAQARARQQREEAATERSRILNEAAGAASSVIIKLIDRYEDVLATAADPAEAEAVLAQIDSVFQGQETTIDGTLVEVRPSGQVAQILNDARRYNTRVASRWQADLAVYRAKLEQFNANSQVMIQNDWADALMAFYKKEAVQLMLLPPGVQTQEMTLNRDPELMRKLVKEQRRLENEAAAKRRIEDRQRSRFQQNRGTATGG